MIDTKYLTNLPARQRAALDAALAAQEGWTGYQAGPHSTHDVQDLERVGLLGWNLPDGEWVTPAGRALVVELAFADATREDLLRRVLAAKPAGRHRAAEPDFADGGFLGTFEQAAMEHTVELAAIAVEPEGLVHRAGRWFTRNLTHARVSALLLSVAVLVVVGGVWMVAR